MPFHCSSILTILSYLFFFSRFHARVDVSYALIDANTICCSRYLCGKRLLDDDLKHIFNFHQPIKNKLNSCLFSFKSAPQKTNCTKSFDDMFISPTALNDEITVLMGTLTGRVKTSESVSSVCKQR